MPLENESARSWIRGQQEAEKIVEQERRDYLATLSSDEALRLYLSLLYCPHPSPTLDSPSPVLQRMRDAVRQGNADQ